MKKTSEQIRAHRRADFFAFYCSETKGVDGEAYKICIANAQEILEFFEAYEDAVVREEVRPVIRHDTK